MGEQTTKTDRVIKDLAFNLDRLDDSTHRLDEVLDALFEVFSERGVKPTPHLQQARDSLKKHVHNVREASQDATLRLEQLRQLVRTTALMTSSLEIDFVLDEVMDTVIYLTGAERAYLMLYDDKKQLKIRAARNWDQQSLNEAEAGLSRGVIDAAIEGGEAIITTNAQSDERFETRESIVIQQLRSIICIPLALRGKTVGVLYADNRLKKDLFQEDMVPMLTAFGTQAAIAISNAQLFGQVKENLEEAERVIKELRIEIDRGSVDQAVADITETDYFISLAATATALREKGRKNRKPDKVDNPDDDMDENED